MRVGRPMQRHPFMSSLFSMNAPTVTMGGTMSWPTVGGRIIQRPAYTATQASNNAAQFQQFQNTLYATLAAQVSINYRNIVQLSHQSKVFDLHV